MRATMISTDEDGNLTLSPPTITREQGHAIYYYSVKHNLKVKDGYGYYSDGRVTATFSNDVKITFNRDGTY